MVRKLSANFGNKYLGCMYPFSKHICTDPTNTGGHAYGLLVAYLGIKIRVLQEIKAISPSARNFKDIMTKKFCNIQCKRNTRFHKKNVCQGAFSSRRQAISFTEDLIHVNLKSINGYNPTILPALLNPGMYILYTISGKCHEINSKNWLKFGESDKKIFRKSFN